MESRVGYEFSAGSLRPPSLLASVRNFTSEGGGEAAPAVSVPGRADGSGGARWQQTKSSRHFVKLGRGRRLPLR